MRRSTVPPEAAAVVAAPNTMGAPWHAEDARDRAPRGRGQRKWLRSRRAVCLVATAPLLLARFLGAVGFCHAEYDPSATGFWAELIEDVRFRTYRLHDIDLQIALGSVALLAALSSHIRVCRAAWRGDGDGRILLVLAGLASYGYSLYVACFDWAAVLLDLKALHFATASLVCVVALALDALHETREARFPGARPAAGCESADRWARRTVPIVLLLAGVTWVATFFIEFDGDWFLFDFALQPSIAVACAGCPSALIAFLRRRNAKFRSGDAWRIVVVLAFYGIVLPSSTLGFVSPMFASSGLLAATCLVLAPFRERTKLALRDAVE